MEQLSSLATDSPGQLDIFGHDSDTLGVDGTQVGVLKQSNQVSFGCLLKIGKCEIKSKNNKM